MPAPIHPHRGTGAVSVDAQRVAGVVAVAHADAAEVGSFRVELDVDDRPAVDLRHGANFTGRVNVPHAHHGFHL